MAKSTKSSTGSGKTAKRTSRKPPNINQVRGRIRELAQTYRYDEQVLLSFAEFVHGGEFKPVEPSMTEMKAAVVSSFGCKDYTDLKKNGSFKLFVQEHGLKMTTKAAWLKVYRKFVGLPDSERNAISDTSINGVDVLRNFLPWKVFALDPKTATADDIKSAFNQLAKQHHPDQGGRADIFEQLKLMRDSLLAAY